MLLVFVVWQTGRQTDSKTEVRERPAHPSFVCLFVGLPRPLENLCEDPILSAVLSKHVHENEHGKMLMSNVSIFRDRFHAHAC